MATGNYFPLLQAVPINVSTSGNTTLIAATSGKLTTVYKLWFVAGAAVSVEFVDGSTPLCGPIPMMSNGSFILNFDNNPWFTGSVNTNFVINLSANAVVAGVVYYTLLVPYTISN